MIFLMVCNLVISFYVELHESPRLTVYQHEGCLNKIQAEIQFSKAFFIVQPGPPLPRSSRKIFASSSMYLSERWDMNNSY